MTLAFLALKLAAVIYAASVAFGLACGWFVERWKRPRLPPLPDGSLHRDDDRCSQ